MRFLIKWGLILLALSAASSALSAGAKAAIWPNAITPTTYTRCADLRKDWPNGIAATAIAASGRLAMPAVNATVYGMNYTLDPDNDGTICTRRTSQ